MRLFLVRGEVAIIWFADGIDNPRNFAQFFDGEVDHEDVGPNCIRFIRCGHGG